MVSFGWWYLEECVMYFFSFVFCMRFLVSYASMYFLPLAYSSIFSYSLLFSLVPYLIDRPTTRRGEKRLS